MNRRQQRGCAWQNCWREAVGFRRFWKGSTLFLTWLCRRHQRWFDHGTRLRARIAEDDF